MLPIERTFPGMVFPNEAFLPSPSSAESQSVLRNLRSVSPPLSLVATPPPPPAAAVPTPGERAILSISIVATIESGELIEHFVTKIFELYKSVDVD